MDALPFERNGKQGRRRTVAETDSTRHNIRLLLQIEKPSDRMVFLWQNTSKYFDTLLKWGVSLASFAILMAVYPRPDFWYELAK